MLLLKRQLITFAGLLVVATTSAFFKPTTLPQDELAKSTPTLIQLDSLGNTIELVYSDGIPTHYYSSIFTPVCNSGECLPIKINLYWNLNGFYQRFDQPIGEILTKADHQPFTPEDYLLLDEILRGPDPRYGTPHIDDSPGDVKRHSNQSNPAPSQSNKQLISKYDMIDGVSGATMIQHQSKFVPGALYTTYTIWGLANDFRHHMYDYTMKHLMTEKNTLAFLNTPSLGMQRTTLEHILSTKNNAEERTNYLMELLPAAEEQLATLIVSLLYPEDFQKETVLKLLNEKFYISKSLELRRTILYKFVYSPCPDYILIKLSESIPLIESLDYEIMSVYSGKSVWPDEVLGNILKSIETLPHDRRYVWLNYLEYRKDFFTHDDWQLIRQVIKTYR